MPASPEHKSQAASAQEFQVILSFCEMNSRAISLRLLPLVALAVGLNDNVKLWGCRATLLHYIVHLYKNIC